MDIAKYKSQMEATIKHLKEEFHLIQVGKASTSLLDWINVDTTYGSMKLPQLGHVSLLDNQTLKIEVWDKAVIWTVQKAIYNADLWLSPSVELSYILVKIPPLTQERRSDIVKKIKVMWEDIKASLRRVRHDAIKSNDKELSEKEISENEHKINIQNIDDLIKNKTKEVDDVAKIKSEEIMKI